MYNVMVLLLQNQIWFDLIKFDNTGVISYRSGLTTLERWQSWYKYEDVAIMTHEATK